MSDQHSGQGGRFGSRFERPIYILIFAGLGCFLLSFFAMGLAPWTTLKKVSTPEMFSANPYYEKDGTLSGIGRGRKIYIAEACWHCHSQFVRPIGGEPFRYGPVSQAWESRFDVPQTFGTRRIGPDLSRTAGRHSDDWHFAHLYNPRLTTPLSVMPGYPWFFEMKDGLPVPKQEAKDLVAYLQFLGRAYKDEVEKMLYPQAIRIERAPELAAADMGRGKQLFQENCSGCHGVEGRGNDLADYFLSPPPVHLGKRLIQPEAVYGILNSGIQGSSMPSFRDMPEKDLWALSHYVSKMGREVVEPMPALAAEMVETGRKTYAQMCAACHGIEGRGDGPAAIALKPRPKDLSTRVFSRAAFVQILKHGVKGSAMPAFPITDEQEKALWSYLTHMSLNSGRSR